MMKSRSAQWLTTWQSLEAVCNTFLKTCHYYDGTKLWVSCTGISFYSVCLLSEVQPCGFSYCTDSWSHCLDRQSQSCKWKQTLIRRGPVGSSENVFINLIVNIILFHIHFLSDKNSRKNQGSVKTNELLIQFETFIDAIKCNCWEY